ncbi:MAG: DUF935 domain-containing protein [Rhizobiaceae bacterium]
MATYAGITDKWGNEIEKDTLSEEIAGPTVSGIRSPLTSYPGDNLNPEKLGQILKAADAGDPIQYLELAETMEERDPHYVGVLGTRKRSVCQLEITVEEYSNDALHIEQAERVREWLKRDELEDEAFDILDAVGKGYSFTEIIWDSSSGQWEPKRLEFRDPRWFRFDRKDGRSPLLIEESGAERPLPAFKFIQHIIRAKSGITVRSGIARAVAWTWMFGMFNQRDWTIFTQNYGQPIRVGKYGQNATKEDRATLLRAVTNIASDCAAIIPESMLLEFIESKTGSTSLSLYKDRADWLNHQISKAVLGQTATTDAIAGGHAVGQEHRQVQEDIERADAKGLASVLNRDLVAPWMMLEYGQEKEHPRIKIGRADQTDVKQVVDAVTKLVPLGLKIGQNQMREIVGVGAPDEKDELLSTPATKANPSKEQEDDEPATEALAAEVSDRTDPTNPADAISRAGREAAEPSIDDLLATMKEIIDSTDTLEEAAELIRAALEKDVPLADLEDAMRQALLLAELTGRAEMQSDI